MVALLMAAPAAAQTADTVSASNPKPLFRSADALLIGGFVVATAVAAPVDKYFTHQLQDDARQANHVLNKGATVFRIFGSPGSLVGSGGLYLIGLAAGNRRVEDLGLHAVGSILLASAITSGIKITAGRARPRKSPGNAADFGMFRGLRDDEYRSFPSGHATAAFAFASIVSAETSHWWPGSRWVLGPVLYGSAALTGVSRIYNNAHWASDVMAGGAIGTLTGIKVYRYQHSHPGNRIDKKFLRAGLQVSNSGGLGLILSSAR